MITLRSKGHPYLEIGGRDYLGTQLAHTWGGDQDLCGFEETLLRGKSVTASPQFPTTVRRAPTERARVTHGPRACVVCSGSQAASGLHCPEKLHLHLLLDCPP